MLRRKHRHGTSTTEKVDLRHIAQLEIELGLVSGPEAGPSLSDEYNSAYAKLKVSMGGDHPLYKMLFGGGEG